MDKTTSNLQSLSARVERLEKQNRLLKRGGLALPLSASTLIVMGQAQNSRTIEAEQFILRDAQGRQRLTIGTPRFSGVAIGMELDEPAMWIADSNGVDRAILTSHSVYWADEHGKPTARIEGIDNFGSGPTIEFQDPKGDKDRLFLSAGRLEMNAPSDLSRGLKDVPMLGPNIFLDDEDGDRIIDLGLSDNRPRLIVGHSLGFHAQLGSADLVTTRTGEEHQTSAASLVLFGKDGKVIWSAP